MSDHAITLTINGRRFSATVEARTSLTDLLRQQAGYTGVHAGCEHGVCGACTVIVDGAAVRSCLMLAVQADGCELVTVEGLAEADGKLHAVQQAMKDEHGLQCGFCTPGILMTMAALKDVDPGALEAAMSGHICRCTGYQGIRNAVRKLVEQAR
jgi:carbon-monoxide dehydrogenase small subunit